MPFNARELRSTISGDGVLTVDLERVVLDDPSEDEVVVRIEAAPINPSDLGPLLGPADIASLTSVEGASRLTFKIPQARLSGV